MKECLVSKDQDLLQHSNQDKHHQLYHYCRNLILRLIAINLRRFINEGVDLVHNMYSISCLLLIKVVRL